MSWRPPRRGDKRDKRCVFTTKFDAKHDHAPVGAMHWCFGCRFYVCERCNEAQLWVGPDHGVELHQPDAPELLN